MKNKILIKDNSSFFLITPNILRINVPNIFFDLSLNILHFLLKKFIGSK